MKYLSIKEGKSFSFKTNEIHGLPQETDIVISDVLYNEFFKKQSEGICLRLKEFHEGEVLFENLFEEYTPQPIEKEKEKTELEIMQETLDTLVLSMLEV
ncbi:hypothetical protein [Clostridium sp. DL1XJH146]